MKRILLPIATFALLSTCLLSFSMEKIKVKDLICAEKNGTIELEKYIENEKIDIKKTNPDTILEICKIIGRGVIIGIGGCNCDIGLYKSKVVRLLLALGANFDPTNRYYNVKLDCWRTTLECNYVYEGILWLTNNFDNSNNKPAFIDNQTNAEIVDMLCKRLWNKYGKKYKKTIYILANKRGLKQYRDCTIRTVV